MSRRQAQKSRAFQRKMAYRSAMSTRLTFQERKHLQTQDFRKEAF
jgi:hypothetical protein